MRKHLFLLPLLLVACSPNVETRGAVQDPDWRKEITVGASTRSDVEHVLGTPSAKSTYGPETWMYITTKEESYAFLKPDVVDQNVTEITFNDDGTVKSIDMIGKDKAKEVAMNSRVTPTEGHQMTFMEQLFGNLGRFNTPESTISNRHGSPTTMGVPGVPY